MDFPVGTIVELVANKHWGWQEHYKALERGERRFYKVVRKRLGHRDLWGIDVADTYVCHYVHVGTGKRRGSWDYSFKEDELRPLIKGPVDLKIYL